MAGMIRRYSGQFLTCVAVAFVAAACGSAGEQRETLEESVRLPPPPPPQAPRPQIRVSCSDNPCTLSSRVLVEYSNMPREAGLRIGLGSDWTSNIYASQSFSTGNASYGKLFFAGLPTGGGLLAWATHADGSFLNNVDSAPFIPSFPTSGGNPCDPAVISSCKFAVANDFADCINNCASETEATAEAGCIAVCQYDNLRYSKACDARCPCADANSRHCQNDAKCQDIASDPQNCGACGSACFDSTKSACSAGVCSPCGNGKQLCGQGMCVDVQSEPANCGACGHSCATGQACVSGICKNPPPPPPPPPISCKTSVDCPMFGKFTERCVSGSCNDKQTGACGPAPSRCVKGGNTRLGLPACPDCGQYDGTAVWGGKVGDGDWYCPASGKWSFDSVQLLCLGL
jgi:hypothetical protein